MVVPAGSSDAALAPLLGALLDRAGAVPDDLAGILAAEAAPYGITEATVYLQDYEQRFLLPLPVAGQPVPASEQVGHGAAGQAFAGNRVVDPAGTGGAGARVWLPLQGATDRVGVLSVVVDGAVAGSAVLGQLAGLVADLFVAKGLSTDYFFRARRTRGMALAAEMQWHLLPPLSLRSPVIEVAGQLTPAYEVGGDSFDYALNEGTLHVGIFDAVGHGLRAAILAGAVVGAYRHARRAGVGLADKYALMDEVVQGQFTGEDFVTAHLADLELASGRLRWINAGHPRPLLVRQGHVPRSLRSRSTLPVGMGGRRPEVVEEQLEPGDRILFFTDGIVEERSPEGVEFGLEEFKTVLARVETARTPLQEVVRRLSAALLESRGGQTSDDATLLMVEWPGPAGG